MESLIDVWPEDQPQLGDGVSCKGDLIEDSLLNATYQLSSVGAFVVERLDGRQCVRNLVEQVCENYQVPEEVAWKDVSVFLTHLNDSYLLRWKTSALAWLAPQRLRLMVVQFLVLREGRPKKNRGHSGILGIVAATVHSQMALIVAAAIISGLVLTTMFASFGAPADYRTALTSSLSPLMLIILLLATNVAHEYSHVLAARRFGRHVAVVRQGFRVSVVHAPCSAAEERLVAVVGPLFGMLSSLGFTLLLASNTVVSALAPLMLIPALAHGLSFLPSSADGRRIWARGDSCE